MNVNLYTFNKKVNSTKVPTSSATTKSCRLKEDTSVISPVLEFTNADVLPSFNYAYIPSFSRYYFINDWQFSNNKWFAYLTVDVLASFKTQIGNQSLYVLRSASDYNQYLKDTIYPVSLDIRTGKAVTDNTVSDLTTNTSITNYFSKSFEDGYYVIGVIGGNNTGVTYYSLDFDGFSSLIEALTDFDPEDFDDVPVGVAKQLANPIQYVTSCYWYPSDPGGLHTGRYINFGYYNILINGVSILGKSTGQGPYIHKFRDTITITRHPQYKDGDIYDWYLNTSPYTERTLVFEPFGSINLDTSKISVGAPSVGVQLDWYVDFTTGKADLYVYDGEENALLGTLSSQFGVPIKVSQLIEDTIQLAKDTTKPITSAIKGATIGALLAVPTGGTSLVASGALASASTLGAGIGALTGFTVGSVESFISRYLDKDPVVNSLGTNGSLLAFNGHKPTIYSTFYQIPDRNNANVGRPLCEIKTLNTLSGFIQCREGYISISAYKQENDLIANYLVSGFFYE